MQIKLVSKNLELTQAIKDYAEKRVTNLGKLLTKIEEKGGEVKVNFELSKSTKHHKQGEVFHSDCTVNVDGKNFYLSVDKGDIYEAIDAVKDGLFKEINKEKDKKQTLYKRGAKSVKKMMKGLSKRNPQTGTYNKKK